MKYIILWAVAFSVVSAQLTLIKNDECKENEAFTTCGSACEPSCDMPTSTFCTMQCVVGCQCESGFLRRKSDNACVKKEQCSEPQAPVLPPPNANVTLNCAANETISDCHNPCTEKKCPIANPPMVNCLMMCSRGCACKVGFVRNNQGVCVKELDCPPIEEVNPCTLTDCRSGLICEVQKGKAVCVAVSRTTRSNPPVLTCATILCQPGYVCKNDPYTGKGGCVKTTTEPTITCANIRCAGGPCMMIERTGCTKGDCAPYPSCVKKNPCETVRCAAGKKCVLKEVQCIKAPCDPIAQCVDDPEQQPPTRPTRSPGLTCMTVKCGTPAGCAMVEPEGCVDGNCDRVPMCIHENACAATSCLTGSECVLQQVTCVKAPCNPVARCAAPKPAKNPCETVKCAKGKKCEVQVVQCFTTPCDPIAQCVDDPAQGSCGANEEFSDCLTPCADQVCNKEPMMCAQFCARSGCRCKNGFVRSQISGLCVSQKQCDAESPRVTRSPPDGPSCMTMRCGTPGGCQMVEPQGCVNGNCQKKPMCIHENACASTTCMIGSECVLQEVTCIKAPCNPVARCAPPKPSGVCGKNERQAPCFNACSEKKCGQTEPMACTKECRGPGCACNEGFFRDKFGKCVTQNECDIQKQG